MNNEVLNQYKKQRLIKFVIILSFVVAVLLFAFISLFVGYSKLGFVDAFKGLFGVGDDKFILIVRQIRLPRVLTAILAGAGLALSGCIMQSILKNPMASPSTLGVSNAAVFGANFAIVILGGGVLGAGSKITINNPYLVTSFAFIFSLISIALILLLSKIKHFSNTTVVLAGLAVGTIFTALTTLIQYFSSDTQLSSSVYWTFGNLSRATYREILVLTIVIFISFILFYLFSWKYNALSGGTELAKSLGIRVEVLTCISLLIASLITALCVSFLGVIGFVGLAAPQIMKRVIGNDHRYLIPSSMLCGSLLLLIADILSRVVMNGITLPVGAITSIFGGPLFIYILLSSKEKKL
ncbi:MAG: iron ABC transporter permease [Bacilli bacterium]|nr:iron ABC transporter permease [Bacilli bacterium]